MRASPHWQRFWCRRLRKTRRHQAAKSNGRRPPAAAHCAAMNIASSSSHATSPGPLAGLKVLELGQLIAGPFAAKTL
ncbi:MAG TPA: hypothetical protein VGJ72_12385, partial [Polaromonas sp.]